MMDKYDESKEYMYIIYLDANNLYRRAMSNYLPYGDFQWVTSNGDMDSDILNISATVSYF